VTHSWYQDQDQDQDLASQDQDQDRIKLVSSALETETTVSRTTSLTNYLRMCCKNLTNGLD